MQKVQKRLVHGCQAPRSLILFLLVVEYSMFFCDACFSWQQVSLVCGYLLLTAMITCNNHGRNVRVRYEQELSLMLKCLMTNAAMFAFLCASLEKLQGYGLGRQALLMAGLSLLQICTITVVCLIGNGMDRKSMNEKRLYLYEKRKPDVEKLANVQVEQIGGAKVQLREKILETDVVYLYDIPAEQRNDLLKLCFELEKPVFFTTKLSDMELRTASLAQDEDAPIYYCETYGIGKKAGRIKRLFDMILSAACLILLAPLFAVIAVCVKLEDGERVFYTQTRCTKDMKEFQIIKFRSMIVGAEDQKGVQLAGTKDPRLTRVGYVLRKCKLDELPQLINILKGDMSFVGPRPERPELIYEIRERVPEFSFRTTVKAGLTGYAQVHGTYHTDFLDKLKWDLMYIENYSLLLDLKIILMTVPTVLRGSDDV